MVRMCWRLLGRLGFARRWRSWTALVAGLSFLGMVATASGDPNPPSVVTNPAISGEPVVGVTLTASHGTWNGTPTISYAYQWQRCNSSGASCANISGATTSSYKLLAADLDSTVRVVVTATNIDGSDDAASAVTALVDAGGPYPATVLDTTGLEHYWRLGESSGTTFTDLLGSSDAATSGVTLGMSGALEDDEDTAASFDGSSSVASADVDLSGTSQLTVEFWLKVASYNDDDDLAMELTSNFNSVDGGFVVDPNDAGGKFAVGLGRGSTRNNVFFDRPSSGVWHHYAFVMDTTASASTQIIPYVDGVVVSYTKDESGTGAGAFADSTLFFMSRNASSLLAAGHVDEVSVYSDALSADDIADHFAASQVNDDPVAAFSRTPSSAIVHQKVKFDATASTDDGSIARYEWDFNGDNAYDETTTTPTTSHVYATTGTRTVRLRVTDNQDVTDTTTLSVAVTAAPTDSYPHAVLSTPGLANYWRMGESIGSTLHDIRGTDDATASNVTLGLTGAPADADTAAGFDGSSSVASAPIDLSSTSQLTVEFWLKVSSYNNDDDLAMELTPNFNSNDGGFVVDPNDAGGKFAAGLGRGSSRNNVFFNRPSSGVWHHYAFVMDTTASASTQIIPYVDGVAVSYTKDDTGEGAGAFADSTLYFMSRNATSLLAAGHLDELALYTSALSAGEIADHFAAAESNDDPTAAFDRAPTTAIVNQEIAFDASDSADPDGSIEQYEWDFNNDDIYDQSTESPTTTHAYSTTGTRVVKLRVTDDHGATATTTHAVTVTAAPNDPYAQAVLQTTGLRSYWRLGESSGSTLSDIRGSHDATATDLTLGATGALTGSDDTAASFDGTTSAASADVHLSSTSEVTVEFWLKVSSYNNDDDLAMELTSNFNSNDGGFIVDPNDAGGKFAVGLGRATNSSRNNVFFDRPSSGTWHHYAFVMDTTADGATQIVPYVDGAPVSYTKGESHTGAGPFADSTLYFMSRNAASLLGAGVLDEVAIYADKLSAQTILAHYDRAFESENGPPAASFSAGPSNPIVGQLIRFDASDSQDSDGNVEGYAWDLDGDDNFGAPDDSPRTTHAYASVGTRDVQLRVTDDDGASDTIEHSVTVHAAPAEPYPAMVLDTGNLANYWRFGEQSGTSLADVRGSDYATATDVTLDTAGALAYDPDTAATFNGTSSFATASLDLSSTSKLTVEFWLKWDAFANDDAIAMELTPNANDNDGGFIVNPNDSGGKFSVALGRGTSRNDVYFDRPTANAWHHYAFVMDTTAAGAGQIIPYVDGEPVSYTKSYNGTGAGAFADSSLWLMARNGTSHHGAGSVDEVAMYSTNLSGATVAAHHDQGVHPGQLPAAVSANLETIARALIRGSARGHTLMTNGPPEIVCNSACDALWDAEHAAMGAVPAQEIRRQIALLRTDLKLLAPLNWLTDYPNIYTSGGPEQLVVDFGVNDLGKHIVGRSTLPSSAVTEPWDGYGLSQFWRKGDLVGFYCTQGGGAYCQRYPVFTPEDSAQMYLYAADPGVTQPENHIPAGGDANPACAQTYGALPGNILTIEWFNFSQFCTPTPWTSWYRFERPHLYAPIDMIYTEEDTAPANVAKVYLTDFKPMPDDDAVRPKLEQLLRDDPARYATAIAWFDNQLGGNSPYPAGPTGSERYGMGAAATTPAFLCGDPVDCASGNFTETQHDLSVGGLGALDLSRTYNAQAAAQSASPGRFGYGWASDFAEKLTIDDVADTVTFTRSDGATQLFYANGDGSHSAAPWVHETLNESSGTYTYTETDRSTMTFDSDGRLTAITDRNGNSTSLTYTGDNLITATAASGRTIMFTYNADGTVASAETSGGREVEYEYDAGNLVSVTDVRGKEWTFAYDPHRRMTTMTSPRGGTTTNVYDDASRVTRQTDPRGKVSTWTYGLTTTTFTDPQGRAKKMTFDHGLPTEVISGYGTPEAAVKRFKYDSKQRVVSMTDPRGQEWTYTYDSAGNRLSATDPLDRTAEWTYNSHRDVLTHTLPSGLETVYDYDTDGNLTSVTRDHSPSDQITTLDYDTEGQLIETADPLGHSTTFDYNTYGDKVSATSELGHETTWDHDGDGYVTSVVSPRGNASGATPTDFTTTYELDDAGNPTQVTDALGHETHMTYDDNGNLATTTDRDGHVTTTTYDAGDLPTAVERDDDATRHIGYDDSGLVVSRTDANGKETTYERDSLGRVVKVTDPNDRMTTYTYDHAGNVKTTTDAAGRVTTNTYDSAGERTRTTYSSHDPGTVTFTYTDDGLMQTMSDETGTSTWTYDDLNRLTAHESGAGQEVGYHYDLADRLTAIDYPDALVPGPANSTPSTVSGGTVTRTYDADDRLVSVEDWLSHETTLSYNADDALTEVERADGTTATRGVDRLDRLTSIDDLGTDYDWSVDYTWTNDGLLATAAETGDGAVSSATYTHDDGERLTSSGSGNQAYDYDPADQPTQLVDASTTRNQEFDDAGQLTRVANGSNATLATVDFDDLGQRTAVDVASGIDLASGYDQAGQLRSYDGPDAAGVSLISQGYGYDGTGLRQFTDLAGDRTHETWDRSGGLPMMLQDGASSFIYGPGGMVIEQITSTGVARFYHHDQLGSVRATTDDEGDVLATRSFTPYGTVKASSGSATSPFGFAGEFTDPSGLQYLRARYYDPATAQFLTRDPLEEQSGSAYGYAGGDPVDYTDPTGLLCLGGYCLRFDPMAGAEALVNVGRGASFGLSDRIVNAISPGASCTIGENRFARMLGSAGATVVSLPYVGSRVGTSRLGRWLFGRSRPNVNSRVSGAGVLNRGPVRVGWGWRGSATSGTDVFRIGLGEPGRLHIDIFDLL